jgi:hypothetical protein
MAFLALDYDHRRQFCPDILRNLPLLRSLNRLDQGFNLAGRQVLPGSKLGVVSSAQLFDLLQVGDQHEVPRKNGPHRTATDEPFAMRPRLGHR